MNEKLRNLYIRCSCDAAMGEDYKWRTRNELPDDLLEERMRDWMYLVEFPERKADYHREIMDRMECARILGKTVQFSRHRIRNDIFFLAVYILGRRDFDSVEVEAADGRVVKRDRTFIYDRCVDVQRNPDGYIDIWAREHYKDLACDTPVLTTEGWKNHGDLRVGDFVYTPKGTSRVVATRHFTDSSCRSVKFKGNQEIVCGAGHLWRAMKWNSSRVEGEKRAGWESVICETSDLMSGYKKPYIPVTGYESCDSELPIAPYTLGVWLGDGESGSGRIYGIDQEVFRNVEKDGYGLSRNHCPNREPFKAMTVYGLAGELRRLNLIGNKHIPPAYFNSSRKQRLALLQGLMDTDGSMSKTHRNGATFVQRDRALASDVLALANSLGYRAGICKAKNAYMVYFSISDDDPVPFRIQRKIDNVEPIASQKQSKNWYVQSVDDHGTVPTNCIQIEDPEGIYLAGYALIPTHNSTIITLMKTIQDILVDPDVTICIYSYNITAATKFLTQVKTTLESNAMLIKLFPDILFDDIGRPWWEDEDGVKHQMVWSSEGFIVKRRTNKKEKTLEASGLVIGQKTGGHFDILVYDDVVTPESVTSEQMITKTTEQFWMSLNTGTTARLRFRIIGTRYHKDDTYEDVIRKGFAKARTWPCIVDGEGVLFDMDALELKRKGMSSYVWASQMMCDPSTGDSRGFKAEWLQRWTDLRLDKLNIYVFVDPAGSTKKKSDKTAMWCVGLGPDSNYYILDLVYDRLDLDGKTNALFDMVRRYTVKHRKPLVYYEKVSMQSDIGHYNYVMNITSYRFPIMEITTGNRPKAQRIDTLVPIFRERRVYCPLTCTHVTADGMTVDMLRQWVDEEYLRYPYGKHDDGLDSLAKMTDGSAMLSFPDVEDVEDYDRRMLEGKGMRFLKDDGDVYDVYRIA
jgi:phage terminase large subunit-like protein